MPKCEQCNKVVDFFNIITLHTPEGKKSICRSCYEEPQKAENQKKMEEEIKNTPKIKCPFCEQWFHKLTEEQYRTSLGGNIARGVVFLPWGVVKAIKNRPYIECPHCKMKIMQG